MEYSDVPQKYLKALFIASQCSHLGLTLNELKAPIDWEIYGLI
jgi:hypothetical protein